MKIAFIGQKGIPVRFGGVEYHVDQLSQELVKRGDEVFVYVRNWYTKKTLHKYKGVNLIHIPTVKTKHLDASLHSFLCSLHVIFKNVDIVHYHGIGPSFFSILPRLFGKRIITTVHRLDWATEKWGKVAKACLKAGELVSSKTSHCIIAVSEEIKIHFREQYATDCILIPNGVTPAKIKPPDSIRKKYSLSGKDFILFMGRLVPEKRADWLIKAFIELSPLSALKKSRLKLVIAGGTSASDDYVAMLRNKSREDPDVIFTGYVSGREKEELLSNAFFFVLPSYLEGFPIVLLEAKSYGLCVLASDISPHKEAIHEGLDGLFFRAFDILDLKRKMKWLAEHPDEASKMGLHALQSTKNSLSWEKVMQRTRKLYERVRHQDR